MLACIETNASLHQVVSKHAMGMGTIAVDGKSHTKTKLDGVYTPEKTYTPFSESIHTVILADNEVYAFLYVNTGALTTTYYTPLIHPL